MEAREILAGLEPVWNGTLERRGEACGLSSYAGPSQLRGGFEDEGLERGECKGDRPIKRGRPIGSRDAKPRKLRIKQKSLDGEVLRLLRLGCSYRMIANKLGCDFGVARRVAKQNGIDRSIYSGAGPQ